MLELQCPNCGQRLGHIRYDAPVPLESRFPCLHCWFVLASDRGIWQALLPERRRYYERFLEEYGIVRAAEGRGSDEASFYLSLPFKDLTGRNRGQWKIRSRSFRCLEREVLPVVEEENRSRLLILDLGAGNGWLSYRLALRGHRPVAVDLRADNRDGLRAASHYLHSLPSLFPRFQSEMDRLPFGSSQFDCAIYNASFHYSEDYAGTLAEAIRCLRPGGAVIIADTPFYSRTESGQQMVAERRAEFENRFGFPSSSLASQEFLTPERMRALEERFAIRWRIFEPKYGLRWAARRPLARWRGKREPSQFRICLAIVKKA